MEKSPAESSAQATACTLRKPQECFNTHDLTANLLDLEDDFGEGNFAAGLTATENCAVRQAY